MFSEMPKIPQTAGRSAVCRVPARTAVAPICAIMRYRFHYPPLPGEAGRSSSVGHRKSHDKSGVMKLLVAKDPINRWGGEAQTPNKSR